MKKQCFIYTEGISDRKFYQKIIDSDKFKYHAKDWEFDFKNHHGGSPEDILQACLNKTKNKAFNKVICIIDLDVIKDKYKKEYIQHCKKLEKKYAGFHILWQEDNLEGEIKKVVPKKTQKKKTSLQKIALKKISLFVNGSLWRRLLNFFK